MPHALASRLRRPGALDAADVLGAATVLLAGAAAYLLVEAALPPPAEFLIRAESPIQAETSPTVRAAVLASAPRRDVEGRMPVPSPW